MRRVGLDLGARHIAYCEVVDGVVVRRASVRRLGELEAFLGPKTPMAQVAFEASREGWHVHDVLAGWGKQPVMPPLDQSAGTESRRQDAKIWSRSQLPLMRALTLSWRLGDLLPLGETRFSLWTTARLHSCLWRPIEATRRRSHKNGFS